MKQLLFPLLLVAGCGNQTGDSGTDGGMCAPARVSARRDITAVPVPGGKAIVYGGDQSPVNTMTATPTRQLVEDVWQIELGCGSWTQLQVPSGAGPRGGYAAAYDSKRDRVIVFGGLAGASAHPPLANDTWALDLTAMTWTHLMPGGTVPATRVAARMAYDADRDRMLLFGGTRNANELDGPGLLDLEELSFAASPDGTWTQLSNGGAGQPTTGWAPAMTVDTQRKLLLVFGGAANFLTFSNKLYAYDLAGSSWHLVTPTGNLPSERIDAQLAYDAARDQLWTFGGHDLGATGILNDTWSAKLDAAGATVTWTQVLNGDTALSTSGVDRNSPERREKHGLLVSGDKLWTMLGGSDCGSLDDVWTLDLTAPTAWTAVEPAQVGETCYRRAMPGQQCPTDVTMECVAPF
jgi:hypothetical protein